ncbi:MAG: hypothetical protein HY820_32295 [Acidobacteria bacterium]|nr:hypothetical protein [Acidobacteriota bacterium]
MLKTITRSVFVPACLIFAAASLPAQTQQTSLKGNYILADEGTGSTGAFASLALLTFTEAGSVSGKEFARTMSGEQWIDIQGNYTFDGANLGSLALTHSSQDAEGNDISVVEHYRFAVSTSGIQAIRSDGSGLSKATLLPAVASLNGAFVFTQLDNLASEARIVAINVDTLGNVTGTSISRDLDSVDVSNVSGTFAPSDNGFGKLTFISQVTDSEDNVQTLNEVYFVLSAADRAIAIRTAGGDIRLTVFSK